MASSLEEFASSIIDVAHPRGMGGTLIGMPIPLPKEGDQRLLLGQRLECDLYAFRGEHGLIVTTVSARNPGDPYPGRDVPNDHSQVAGIGPAERERLDNGRWTITFEMLDPGRDVTQAILFQAKLADRLAELTQGAVLDTEACRGYLPGEWHGAGGTEPFDLLHHVVMHLTRGESGATWVHTHGMVKFGCPEMEILDVPTELESTAAASLYVFGGQAARGAPIEPGERLGDPTVPLYVRLAKERIKGHYLSAAVEFVDTDARRNPVKRGAVRGLAAIDQMTLDYEQQEEDPGPGRPEPQARPE